jgi:hypothetical protein
MRPLTSIVLLLLTAAPLVRAAQPLPPAQLLAQIDAIGPRKVIEQLWLDEDQWNGVIARIASGNHDWIEVARRLRPGADAENGAPEALDLAVFRAMVRSPVQVLLLLHEGQYPLAQICSSNIAADLSKNEARSLLSSGIGALGRVREIGLQDTRARCDRGLREALQDIPY